ncbi:MAG TPA: LysM peptidoglycan-binding domain-containing protein [Terriglobales bacterium]|nr:LysM peptidoglycan-binding domain-containing protein [Terriglobales bacterium]
MRLHRASSSILALAVVVIGTACESSKSQKTRTTPPPQAIAPTIAAETKPAAPAPIASAPQKPDPVEKMIRDSEKEYQAGRANVRDGHLEAAKTNFDRAMGFLMEGPVDVGSDERLQRQFSKIVENVHQLEMAALKEGDGFTEQRAEPAPIDEANDVTFPVDPAVTAKAQAELKGIRSDIPLVINDYVASYLNFFSTRGKETLVRGWKRAGRYQGMIRRVLAEEGLPQDLIYLAQAESGFHPLAISRVGARGMWQFMHYTAPGYGLKRSWWVDDRQDPDKSTRAAARYLKDLYNQFGDWYLAIAAYNSGGGNVQRAVERTGYADFWELYRRNVLPNETKNYVPIIVAITIIAKNPTQYGLSESLTDVPEDFETVKVDYAVDLRLVAEAIDQPLDLLMELNPSLLRRTTPKDEEFNLKLPLGTRARYIAAMEAIPRDKRVAWRYHKVAPGESLSTLAKKYRTTAQAISEVNNLEGNELEADAKVIIPVSGRTSDTATTFAKKPTRYTVRKGDTVLTVADDFGVPAERVRRWNRLKGNSLRKGRTLLIYKPVGPGEAAESAAVKGSSRSGKKTTKSITATKRHTVRSGETLSSIASRYGTSVAQLHKNNAKIGNRIKPGDVIVITR